MDDGLGMLRMTVFDHTLPAGSDILPIITYGMNLNGELNLIFRTSNYLNLYVAGWVDTAPTDRSNFIMAIDVSYPWDRIFDCLYT